MKYVIMLFLCLSLSACGILTHHEDQLILNVPEELLVKPDHLDTLE